MTTKKCHLAFASDTHFNLTTKNRIIKFCDFIQNSSATSLVLTGDLAESDSMVHYLEFIASKLGSGFPVYFILGNHDYYKTNTEGFNIKLKPRIEHHPNLRWLTPQVDTIALTEFTALVGHENWWDGRGGDLEYSGVLDSLVMAPDYTLIQDFAWLRKKERFEILRFMADLSTRDILRKVSKAFMEGYKTVYLAVHVPPFPEACVHQDGKLMNKKWLIHFCHKDLGDKLVQLMSKIPDKNLVVLAGHTHEEIVTHPIPNIKVMVAKASYFTPRVHKILEIE